MKAALALGGSDAVDAGWWEQRDKGPGPGWGEEGLRCGGSYLTALRR